MIDSDDIDYFNARALAERELSEAATDEAVAQVHLKLAERYERLVARLKSPRPVLHIVTPRSA